MDEFNSLSLFNPDINMAQEPSTFNQNPIGSQNQNMSNNQLPFNYQWSSLLQMVCGPPQGREPITTYIKCFIVYVEFRTPNLRLKSEPLIQQATVLLGNVIYNLKCFIFKNRFL